MHDHTFTLIVSAVGIAGALAGIVIGHFLTRSSQHHQWLRDNRKEEFRETISALTEATIEHLAYITSQGTSEPEPRSVWLTAQKIAFRVITDRIFIANDLQKLNVSDRYLALTDKLRDASDKFEEPAKHINELINEIVAVAKKG